MAFSQPNGAKIVAAIPMGRNAVCWQPFQKQTEIVAALDEPRTMPEEEFLSMVLNEANAAYVLHAALYEKGSYAKGIINFGANIAYAVGLICHRNASIVTEPLFISKSF